MTSATGGRVDVSTHVSAPGFNPLDLLYGSIAACLVLSARNEAQRLGVLDRIEDIRAAVAGEKAPDPPSRVARILIEIEIEGALDEPTRRRIAHEAEAELCTVSNTLRGSPVIEAVLIDRTVAGNVRAPLRHETQPLEAT